MAFFSIVIPTANRARWIEYGLKSLKSQTFKDFEVIVSDNGDDNTKEIFDKYADERFKYIKCPKKGLTANWKFAFPYANGKYVGYIQNKMFFYSDALEKTYNYINESNLPETIVYYSDLYELDDNTEEARNTSGILNFQEPILTGWKYVDSMTTLLDRMSWKDYTMSTKRAVGNGCIIIGFLHSGLIERVQKKYGEFFDCIFPDFGGAILPLYESKKNIEITEHLSVYISLDETTGARMTQYHSKLKEFIKLSGKEHIMQYATVHNYCVSNTNVATADYNYLMSKIPELKNLKCNRLNALIATAIEKQRLREDVTPEEEALFINAVNDLSESEKVYYNFLSKSYPREEENLNYIKECSSPDEVIERPLDKDRKNDVLPDLLNFCKKHKEIYCYGAGHWGEVVYRCLKMLGIKVSGFIITGRPQEAFVDGVRVYSIEEIDVDTGDKGIILSLDKIWHGEIVDILEKRGLPKDNVHRILSFRTIRMLIDRYIQKI
ncbi:MAG: glycosyltransferase family 2 protein [Selenomonadaceae bacterium]|nr:glycosyltransferase family 2 protein [Selenomonadaceae bacterium]